MNQKTNLEIISEILAKYKDHQSIVKIKSNKIGNEFHTVKEAEIKNTFLEIYPEKSTGEDQIPAKLVKLSISTKAFDLQFFLIMLSVPQLLL